MAFVSIKNVFARAALATPEQFDEWSKLWRVATDGGAQESLIAFMAREAGLTEETFLEKLAGALGWPFLNLKTLDSRRNTVENTQLVRAVFRAMSDDLRSAVQMEPVDFNGVQSMVSPASSTPGDTSEERTISASTTSARPPCGALPGRSCARTRSRADRLLRRPNCQLERMMMVMCLHELCLHLYYHCYLFEL